MKEYQLKLTRLKEMLVSQNLDGIVLTQQKNFSWLTSGRGFVNQASEKAIASILVTLDTVTLIASNIEAQRLVEEEISGLVDRVEIFPWHQPAKMVEITAKLSEGLQVKNDLILENQLVELRTALTEREIQRIRKLGEDTANAIEETAFAINPGETEYQIAARLSANCLVRGIEPIVNLIAVDARAYSRRHPLPTQKKMENYAMLVIGGRRQGQIVSATRLVHFGQPSEELLSRLHAVATIDTLLIGKTRPGARFSELFLQMNEAYQGVGFTEEWMKHHQGGLSGYLSREKLLLPESNHKVQLDQVFAWNPSIAGVKSEDTILVTEQKNEILTQTKRYPLIEIKASDQVIKRPGLLIR
jgi:Xaa-Pro aminopeptidase